LAFYLNVRNLVLGLVFIVCGCATPDPELWPPTSGAPTKEIFVSLDTWHAMIGFQEGPTQDQGNPGQDPQAQSPSLQPTMFEEWGYAERTWYLEGQQGISGVLRALFWPSEGVVEVAGYDRLWANRTPQPPSDLFKFELSEEGFKRLRTHLRSTRASSNPVEAFSKSRFYLATNSYHLFHHCHQYVARALYTAGLPISPLWAFSKASLSVQLEKIEDLESQRTMTSNSTH